MQIVHKGNLFLGSVALYRYTMVCFIHSPVYIGSALVPVFGHYE